jgi:hypothetical protein
MTDRTRESTRVEERSNRLLALGKLAAGLAHELNNPASAAVRSSARLREVLKERRNNALALRSEKIPEPALQVMTDLSHGIEECTSTPGAKDELERADLEGDLSDWLETEGLPCDSASELVDAGVTSGQIAPLVPLITTTVSIVAFTSWWPTTRFSASRGSWRRLHAAFQSWSSQSNRILYGPEPSR